MIPTMTEVPIDHLRKLAAVIDRTDQESSFEEVFNLVANFMQGYVALYLLLEQEPQVFDIANPDHAFGIFRVRKINRISDVQYEKQLWAREASKVDDYGRCHSPQSSVLYCANNIGVALIEANVKEGDYLTLTRFESKPNSDPIFVTSAGVKRKVIKADPAINPSKMDTVDENVSKKTRAKIHLLEKYIVKWFGEKVLRGNEHRYLITSAICKFFRDGAGDHPALGKVHLEGVIYPSVKNDGFSFNFAFDTEAALNKLQIETIVMARVEKITSERVNVQLLFAVHELQDGERMTWQKIKGANILQQDLDFLNES